MLYDCTFRPRARRRKLFRLKKLNRKFNSQKQKTVVDHSVSDMLLGDFMASAGMDPAILYVKDGIDFTNNRKKQAYIQTIRMVNSSS